jgi:hypothetical protein
MNKVINVINVAALPGGLLQVEFADGRVGEFDVKPSMAFEYFSKLKAKQYFERVGLFFSGVGWPDGQDLGPDTISAHLLQTEMHSN